METHLALILNVLSRVRVKLKSDFINFYNLSSYINFRGNILMTFKPFS